MPAAPKPTFWSLWWLGLRWNLLLVPLAGVCLILALSDYPALAWLPLVVYHWFYVRAAARVTRGLRGKIVRSDGSEAPRTLRNTLPSAVLFVALGCLIYFYGFYLLLAFFAIALVSVLLRPFAIRYGWFEEGRITALVNRPRFIEERFRGTLDPTGGAGPVPRKL